MSTRSKYTRVRPQEDKNQSKPDTDIIMRFSNNYGKYIGRALTLFFGEDKSFVTIKAAERVIDRALWVAEVVKRKVAGLHQVITITEKKVVDVYLPREEGLVKVEKERFITIIEITLTKEPTAEQKKAPGYQSPIKTDTGDFLTKEKWQEREKEMANKRENREERKNDRRGGRPGGQRAQRGGQRGQERRRGRR